MNILLICSVSSVLTVGVYKNGEVFSADSQALQRDHSAQINGCVERALSQAELSFKDLDAYACVIGPGSFTGIRVGIATVKGYAAVHPAPFIAVNTLELAAYNKAETIVQADAGKGKVYRAEIKDGRISQTVMGEPISGAISFDVNRSYIREFAEIAAEKFRKGEFSQRLSPLYVQLCQAENEFNAKNELPVIRKITVGDVASVLEIDKQCLPEEAWSYDMFVEELEQPTADIYGVFVQGVAAGFAQIRFDGEQIYLGNIAVLAEYRRRGLASALLERIFSDYNDRALSCFLHVRKSNQSAVAFYEAAGFETVSEIKDYYSDKQAALAMLKELK